MNSTSPVYSDIREFEDFPVTLDLFDERGLSPVLTLAVTPLQPLLWENWPVYESTREWLTY